MITLEQFEQLDCGVHSVFCTESVSDISNWLLNKPKPYRIVYDSRFGVWAIGEANLVTHYYIKYAVGNSGYLNKFPEFNKIIEDERNRIRTRYFRVIRSDAYKDMLSSGEIYANSAIGGILFYPTDYDEPEETMYYPYRIPIVSGTILTASEHELETDYSPLYKKLQTLGVFLESDADRLNRIWDSVKNEDCPLEKFNTLAADEGFDYDTILNFILSKIR